MNPHQDLSPLEDISFSSISSQLLIVKFTISIMEKGKWYKRL